MKVFFIVIALGFLAASANGTPIYMQYEGIDGSVMQEPMNEKGDVTLGVLRPGTYKLSILYTGDDIPMANGRPASGGHVKVFDGRTGATSSATGGAGSGKAKFNEFTIKKINDATVISRNGKASIKKFDITFSSSSRGLSGELVTLTVPTDNTASSWNFSVRMESFR